MMNEYGQIESIDGVFYANSKFLASILELTKGRIAQMSAEGFFLKEETEEYGPMFNLIDSIQAYWNKRLSVETEEDRKIRRERAKAEASIKRSKADIAKLEAAELKGRMFRVEDIKAITEDYFYEIRSLINALPGQLAVDVAASDNAAECAVIIRTCINRLLMNMQKYRFDPEQYQERVRDRKKIGGYNDDLDDGNE